MCFKVQALIDYIYLCFIIVSSTDLFPPFNQLSFTSYFNRFRYYVPPFFRISPFFRHEPISHKVFIFGGVVQIITPIIEIQIKLALISLPSRILHLSEYFNVNNRVVSAIVHAHTNTDTHTHKHTWNYSRRIILLVFFQGVMPPATEALVFLGSFHY